MIVRTNTAAELPAVLELVGAAFAEEPAVVDLVRELAADASFVPGLSLVAEDAGALVGYVLLTRAEVGESATGVLPVLILAPLGVSPSHQRQGIGSRLVEEALDRARDRGESAVLVLGDPAYYGRFGFRPAQPFGIDPPHLVEYAEAWMVLELAQGSLAGHTGVVRLGAPLEDPKYWQP